MNYKKILTLGLGFMLMGGSCMDCSVEASNLDTYRNLLMKQTYTIRYVDITPEVRMTNKDKIPMYGRNTMDQSQSCFLTNKQVEYLLVADGENKYEEMEAGDFKQCRLVKGDDTYVFVKHRNNGIEDIWGSKKGVVSPMKRNLRAEAMAGASYGGSKMTRYLNAMLPNENKSKDMPVFNYVRTGWLSNGMNYEDYTSTNDGVFEAVRYYFDGYNLVKIAAVEYWTNSNGVMEGNKTIIKINEFSPTPDQTYLELPKGVKDNSKDSKDEEKQESE